MVFEKHLFATFAWLDYTDGQHESSSKVKPESLDRPLLADCSERMSFSLHHYLDGMEINRLQIMKWLLLLPRGNVSFFSLIKANQQFQEAPLLVMRWIVF